MKRLIIAIFSFIFLINVIQGDSVPASGSDGTSHKNTSIPQNENSSNAAVSSLNEIKSLRSAGKLDEAGTAAKRYLEKHPDDVDVMLLLGLIYIQKQNDSKGDQYLNKVLLKVPDYMDARIALIRLKIKNKQLQGAKSLIHTGLKQAPTQAELLDLQEKLTQLESQPTAIKKADEDSTRVLSEIQELRQQNHLERAKEKAISFLKEHPDDPDISLMLGLIYYAQRDYANSEIHLKAVLDSTPEYVDARVALVRIKLFQKDYQEAKLLLDKGLAIHAKEEQLLHLKDKLLALTSEEKIKKTVKKLPKKLAPWVQELQRAKKHLIEKQFSKAQAIYRGLVKISPCNVDFNIALADYYLARNNDQAALSTVSQALACNPDNVKLMIKKGEVHRILRQYSLAANSYRRALTLEPKNESARDLLDEIVEISPRHLYGLNEIGIWSDSAYVSDLHSTWNWTSIYYARDTDWGRAMVKVNHASRLGINGEQYEFNFLARFNRSIYFDLAAAYSKNPSLFPTFLSAAEAYLNVPNFFELSAGGKHSEIDRTYFNTYTASINFYPGFWWFSFRPYYFAPKDRDKDSILYTARARRYFATDDHYIGLGAGVGRSPDLADLLTVNFIVIKNSFINANYTFPILNHHIIVDLGAGYQRWVYPSNLVRKLYDASIGFRYRL